MSKQSRRNFLKLAGATAATVVTGSAMASENPFSFKSVDTADQQVAMEGKCGSNMKEGKCGAGMKKEGTKMEEGKCGANMKEGKCGANMTKEGAKMEEGKCGANMKEGKCGANMTN